MQDPTRGPAREPIDRDELDRMQRAVVADGRRTRPMYFDGRFLAARDLTREQQYFLARQADLGRAGGAGVVYGLMVDRVEAPGSLRIDAGHGVTPAGEMVTLPSPMVVNLLDIPTIQRLDATFGLIQIPREPARNRTGLFVVALRPIEFTANPIASYPTSVTGTRGAEDGDIVEGVAVTLIPYPDAAADLGAEQRRARAAYEVFVDRGGRGVGASVLPLAMVSVNRGTVQWVDPFLVRREVGADHGDVLGLGFAPRALREAHLLQYEHHLRDVLALRDAGNRGWRFAASDHFQAIPPAGRMPAAAIDPRDFTQIFFPPEVDVELSVVPEDELVGLLDESLLLPPIDLTLSARELESTSVLALIPVPRSTYRTLSARLGAAPVRALPPSAPWLVARRRPLELLQGLRLPGRVVPLPDPQDTADDAWRGLLADNGLLWYVRRRNLHHRPNVAGEPIELGDAGRLESLVEAGRAIGGAGLRDRVLLLVAREEVADPEATERTEALLADPRFGAGLARLEAEVPELRTNDVAVLNLARSGVLLDLDRLARDATRAELSSLTEEVAAIARSTGVTAPSRINRLVTERIGGGER